MYDNNFEDSGHQVTEKSGSLQLETNQISSDFKIFSVYCTERIFKTLEVGGQVQPKGLSELSIVSKKKKKKRRPWRRESVGHSQRAGSYIEVIPCLFSRTLMIIGMRENDSRSGKESSKRIRRNSANLSCRTGNRAASHQTGRETLIPQVTSVIRNNSQKIENTSCSY